jgi:hypothetical protein
MFSMLLRRFYPTRHRILFVVAIVLLRVIVYAVLLFKMLILLPLPASIAVSLASIAVMAGVWKLAGWYEPKPSTNASGEPGSTAIAQSPNTAAMLAKYATPSAPQAPTTPAAAMPHSGLATRVAPVASAPMPPRAVDAAALVTAPVVSTPAPTQGSVTDASEVTGSTASTTSHIARTLPSWTPPELPSWTPHELPSFAELSRSN